ncbi:MAG: GNAT family N-acetyltransferase [Thermoplasmata archaeon]|nr:GNAT family N-acetyltransferase [Thermoplasmata archaeon]
MNTGPSPTTDLPEDLVARCHANTIEDYRAFARVSAGGAIEEAPGVVIISTGDSDSMGNPAFVTHPPSDPKAVVERIRAFYDSRKLPWILIAFPESRTSVEPEAVRAGLFAEGSFPGMILHPIPSATSPEPTGFHVERVGTLERLRTLERTGCLAYGKPYAEPDPRWLEAPGVSLYLGYDGDQPVSLAALIVAHRIAGIAYVGTVPAARRRGFAEGVVRRAVADGREQGCDASYLWATPMGRPIYARMGFRRILDYEIWSAPGTPMPAAIRPS